MAAKVVNSSHKKSVKLRRPSQAWLKIRRRNNGRTMILIDRNRKTSRPRNHPLLRMRQKHLLVRNLIGMDGKNTEILRFSTSEHDLDLFSVLMIPERMNYEQLKAKIKTLIHRHNYFHCQPNGKVAGHAKCNAQFAVPTH